MLKFSFSLPDRYQTKFEVTDTDKRASLLRCYINYCAKAFWNFKRTLFTNFRNKLVFVPGKPFLPSLMFVGKAGAYPSEASFRCSAIG